MAIMSRPTEELYAPEVKKDEGSFGDVLLNFNTTYNIAKNLTEEDAKYVLPKPEDDTSPKFDWESDRAKELMKDVPSNILERVPYDVKSEKEFEVRVNRIKQADEAMQRAVESYGIVPTMLMGIGSSIALDPIDLALGGPLVKALRTGYKAAKVESGSAKGVITGSTLAVGSEALYQSALGESNGKALAAAFGFGSVLGGTIGALSKTRGKHEFIEGTTEEGAAYQRVLTEEESLAARVEGQKKVFDEAVATKKDLDTQLKEASAEVKTAREAEVLYKKENLPAKEAEFKALAKEHKAIQQEIKLQQEATVYKQARQATETAKTFNTKLEETYKNIKATRSNEIKNTKAEIKALNKELKSKGIDIEAHKDVIALTKKQRATYKNALEDADQYEAFSKNPESVTILEKIKKIDVAKIDENVKLINKYKAKVDKLDEAVAALTKAEEARKMKVEVPKAPKKNKKYEDVKPKDGEELTKRLEETSPEKVKAELVKIKENMTANTARTTKAKENLQRLAEGKPAVKEAVVKERTAYETLAKELEELETKKLDYERVAAEGEGFIEKVGGFMPYISPRSVLHSSNNKFVRGLGNMLYPPAVVQKNAAGMLVPTRANAKELKNRLEAKWTMALTKLTNEFRQAVKAGYKGSEGQFIDEVTKGYITANAKAKREADLIKGKGEEAVITPVYKNDNQYIANSMEHLNGYFKEMGELGKKMGVEGLKTVNIGPYFPRLWNYNKMMKMGRPAAIQNIVDAMAKNPKNADLPEEELFKRATDLVDSLADNNFYQQLIKDPDIKTPGSMHQKARTIEVYDDDIIDLIETDYLRAGSAYSYTMSGRMALHNFLGTSTTEGISAVLNKATANGATVKEVDSLKVLIDTIRGTRELMSNPNSFYGKTLRYLTKGNYMVYGMGFGLTSMVEIGNIVATTGVRNTVGMHFDSILSARKHMIGDESSKKWIDEFRAIGLVGDIISARSHQRYDAVDTINTNGLVEETMDRWTNAISKYSGMLPLTDALKTLAIGSGYNFLIKMAKESSHSAADLNRLYRLGLDTNDLKILKEMDSKYSTYDKNGHLEAFNFEKWDQDFGQKVQNALMNHSESTVLHPDGATLPMWMSDPNSPIAKIMFQFMRFPISAYEQLTLRGFTEFDAKQIIGVTANIGLFTLLAQIKDMGKENPRFDLSTDEGWKNTMMYAATNNYLSGSILTLAEKGLTLGTGHQPFSTWSQGVSGFLGISANTLKNGQTLVSSLIEGDTYKILDSAKSLSPLQSTMVLGNVTDAWLAEAYDKPLKKFSGPNSDLMERLLVDSSKRHEEIEKERQEFIRVKEAYSQVPVTQEEPTK